MRGAERIGIILRGGDESPETAGCKAESDSWAAVSVRALTEVQPRNSTGERPPIPSLEYGLNPGESTMGYSLHITRARYWLENEGNQITPEEWLAVVQSDPELRLAGYNGPYFALWCGESRHPEPWFNWRNGNVETKNPDDPVTEKMVGIAKRLDAEVQGDDGEVYTYEPRKSDQIS